MRDYLFRGKRKNNAEWAEGGISVEDNCTYIIGKVRYYPDTRDSYTLDYYEENPHYRIGKIMVIPETVGQFTGKCDKNGKKIFEGDIVRAMMDYGPAGMIESIVDIGFKQSIGGYRWNYFDMSTIEVIGNVYDNFDLLKGD